MSLVQLLMESHTDMLDIGFCHPECDMYPAGENNPNEVGMTTRIILGADPHTSL